MISYTKTVIDRRPVHKLAFDIAFPERRTYCGRTNQYLKLSPVWPKVTCELCLMRRRFILKKVQPVQ